MAKNRGNNNPVADSEEADVMEDAEQQRGGEERSERVSRPATNRGGVNLFKVYKPNQGKRTRVGTALGAGLLLVWGWDWSYSHLHTAAFVGNREWLAALIAVGLSGLAAALTWYLVGVRPGSVDFLVATEGEMKKVTWSSKKEVWGATKVVIGMVLLMAVGLFTVDLLFTWFFSSIGVLKSPFGS